MALKRGPCKSQMTDDSHVNRNGSLLAGIVSPNKIRNKSKIKDVLYEKYRELKWDQWPRTETAREQVGL